MSFAEVWKRASLIPGWYTEEEARCLYEHAVSPWLEVGSWMGRSATVLASSGPGVCLDTFRGSAAHSEEMRAIHDGVDVEQMLRLNLAPLGRKVIIRRLPMEGTNWMVDMQFLHLDAGHDVGETEEAFRTYTPVVAAGGLVAFHDYDDPGWPDVKAFCDTLDWTRVAQAGRTLIVRKP